jgi:hypothetical protein
MLVLNKNMPALNKTRVGVGGLDCSLSATWTTATTWKEMMARVTVGAGELSIIHAGPSGVSVFATPPRGLLSPLVQQRHERLYKFTPPRGLLSTLQQRHGRPYKFHTATTSLASTDQATMDLSGDLGVRCSYGLPLLLLWHSQHDT